MLQLLITSIMVSLFCCGLKAITEQGMLFEFVVRFFDDIIESKNANNLNWMGYTIFYIGKPLILCITCMASVWTVIVWLLLGLDFNGTIVISAVISSFLNNVFYYLSQKI